MQYTLGLETSTATSHVALIGHDAVQGGVQSDGDGDVLAQSTLTVDQAHTEVLLPQIETVLHLAGVGFAEVTLIGIGVGPGVFTGLRVGLATAKALHCAWNIPVVGINSLQATRADDLQATRANDAGRAVGSPGGVAAAVDVVVMDARRGEVYAAAYARRSGPRVDDELVAPFVAMPHIAVAQLRAQLPSQCAWRVGGSGLELCRSALIEAGEGAAEGGSTLRWLEVFNAVPNAAQTAKLARRLWTCRGADDAATLEPLYVRRADAKLPATTPTAAGVV